VKNIAVIGAGIVGICSAYFLKKSGFNVTLIDREQPGSMTSFGHACTFADYANVPVNYPGLIWDIPSMLLKKDGPLAVDFFYILKNLPWAISFLKNCKKEKVNEIANSLTNLLKHSQISYDEIFQDVNVKEYISYEENLYLFDSKKSYENYEYANIIRKNNNVKVRNLNKDEVKELEPNLADVYYSGQVFTGSRHTTNPLAISTKIFEKFLELGGVYINQNIKNLTQKEKNIELLINLPGVGENLHDHPVMPMNWAFQNNNLSFSKYQRIDRAIIVGLKYILFKQGLAAAPFWSTNLFHAIREKDMPEIQVFMTPMCFKEEKDNWSMSLDNLLNFGSLFFSRGKKAFPGLHFQINLLRPKSTGSVKLKSSNPNDELNINPNWFIDPSDMEDMIEGMKHTREVLSKPSLAKIVSEELLPGKKIKSDQDLKESVRNHVQTGHHPASTCAMGSSNNKMAVLDNQLKVRGIDNLRVVDASSFPDMISGNINASVIMLAEKASDMILKN